ncbi:MAG: RtcB family protein [Firmicutes bacterium]|nr:RtcB family protein [Bacillota bacterium]
MIEVKGTYGTAKIFTDKVEEKTMEQIKTLLEQGFVQGATIRIMPDTHAGAGSTIGTTITVKDKVVPNMVGVDIGCGMETVRLKQKDIDLEKLDREIHRNIPSGHNVRKAPHPYIEKASLNKLKIAKILGSKAIDRAVLSMGTLGGGNHFIELNRCDATKPKTAGGTLSGLVGKMPCGCEADEKGNGTSCGDIYLVVHSGSRNIGHKTCEYYQRLAVKQLHQTRKTLKADYRIDSGLEFLIGEGFNDYIHDMTILQEYAAINRRAIVEDITRRVGLQAAESFTTVHNFIDPRDMILRKGAISAHKGEQVLIPFNMRDGSIIAVGKGNPDWNNSAPHGAGRIMSRTAALKNLKMEDFQKAMQGIHSTTIKRSTLDEAPFAYKPLNEITAHIPPTAEITRRLRVLYNFKAPG